MAIFFRTTKQKCIHKRSARPLNLYPSAGSELPLCWIQAKTAHALDCISVPRCNIQTVQVLPVMLLMSVTVSARDLTGFEQLIDKRTT